MSNNIVEESTNPYSRLLSWEVWNFMAIEHARCDFDGTNIINLKGYNDSGKSAMLNALKVLLHNFSPTKQVSFIQDDKEYFRIIAYFEDGVQILRDKYINGQSLYEMYKDGACIYSTKSGNALTRVSEVPQPISDYLGLIMYDGVCLNARACFEKQIGVQTSGSENYKMFNTVLKSEEIATAGSLLNNDKNKLASDIAATESDLDVQKKLLGDKGNLTEGMVSYLKSHDADLDSYEAMYSKLSSMANTVSALGEIKVSPEVGYVDMTQVADLSRLSGIMQELSGVVVSPELPVVDISRLETLNNIVSMHKALGNVVIAPEVGVLDSTRLTNLSVIQKMVDDLNFYSIEIADEDTRLSNISQELAELQTQLTSLGVKMIKCPGCGQIFNPDEVHAHG